MELYQAKKYIRKSIIPKLNSMESRSSIRGKLKIDLMSIYKEHRPDILEYWENISKCNKMTASPKYHLIYCFLYDEPIYWYTGYFKINSQRAREYEDVSLKEYAQKVSLKTNTPTKQLCDFGMDIKYPKMMEYSHSKIVKLVHKLNAKYLKCLVCGKTARIKFKHQVTCGLKCQAKLSSKRMKVNNPSQVYGISENQRKKQSTIMKRKILNGEFTPCVTNSWASSKIFIKEFNQNFRSSWEAYFYLYMKNNSIDIKYEKVRIPYYDSENNKNRIYITDFVDYNNKIIYEIKPNGCKNSINVIEKETAAQKWCKENNYIFKYISNGWFEENYDPELVYLTEMSEYNKEKIVRLLKQFK